MKNFQILCTAVLLLYFILCQIKDPIMESHSSLKSLILLLLCEIFYDPGSKELPWVGVCEWREYHSSVCHHFPMGFWTFTAISTYTEQRRKKIAKKYNCFSLLLTSDASEMSKTSLPLIAFALLAHFHTSFIFCNVSRNRSNTQQSY